MPSEKFLQLKRKKEEEKEESDDIEIDDDLDDNADLDEDESEEDEDDFKEVVGVRRGSPILDDDEEPKKETRKKGVKRPDATTINVPYSQWTALDKLKKKLKLRKFDQVIEVLLESYGDN